MIMNEILLVILSVLASLVLTFIFVSIGWYFVWIFFLSRFRFVREILGGMTEASSNNENAKSSRLKKSRLE